MAPLMASCNSLKNRGYTYFGVLLAVALIGLSLAGAAAIWKVLQQREKERELLFVGQQYIDAISSYYHAAPGGAKKYPRNMTELLRDPRYPNIKRHLRKPWRDPLTGSSQWGIVLTKQGGIAGIYSQAEGTPLKQAGFGALDALLAGKPSYRDWRFIYIAATDDTPKETSDNQDAESSGDGSEGQDAVENTSDEGGEEETGEELLPEQDEKTPPGAPGR
jgi:type II secretory pathway pseudopilin PulG